MKKIFLLLIGIIIFLTGCGKKELNQEVPVKIAKTFIVRNSFSTVNREFPGTVESSSKTNLSFDISGRLINLPIEEGQKVQKGQILAQIDSDSQKFKLEAVKANLFEAEEQYRRYKVLYEKDYVAKADYQAKEKIYEVTKSALSLAQKGLKDTVIKAPFSGVITKKIADNHDFVNAKETIAVLQDLNNLDIEINIPEKLMVSNNKNYNYSIEFRNYPGQKFPLKLKSVSKQKDKVTDTYLATFYLKNRENVSILPGMTATVIIKSNDKNSSGLEIPVNAIFSDSDKQQYVWTVSKDSIAVKKNIKIKEFLNNQALISSGLENNTRIIVSGVHHILEGDKIKEYKRLDLDK